MLKLQVTASPVGSVSDRFEQETHESISYLIFAVLSTPKDTNRIRQKLAEGGSLAGVHEAEEYGHMDYIW